MVVRPCPLVGVRVGSGVGVRVPGDCAAARAQVVAALLEPELVRLGASLGSLLLRSADGAELEPVWSFGLSEELAHAWRRLPVSASLPVADAVRLDEVMAVGSLAERVARHPALSVAPGTSAGAILAAPLHPPTPGGARVAGMVGALGVGFPDRRGLDPAVRAAVADLARRCAGELAAFNLLPMPHPRAPGIGGTPPGKSDLAAVGRPPADWLARSANPRPAGAADSVPELAPPMLGAVLEAGRLGVYYGDSRTGLISWTRSMERLCGLEPGSFGGRLKDFLAVVHPDDRPALLANAAEAVESGRQTVRYRVVLPGGAIRWVEARSRPVDPDDPAGVWLGVAVDISELKTAEDELTAAVRAEAETAALLDSLISTAPIGFAVFDRELRYVRVNRVLAEIDGFPAEAHLGRRPSELLPDLAEAGDRLLRSVLETGQPNLEVKLSGEVPSTPGVRRHWMVSDYPVRGADGGLDGVAAVVWEITERERAEADRARLLDRQQRLQQVTARLAAAADAAAVLDVLATDAAALLGATMANVSTLDEDERTLHLVLAINTPAEVVEQFASYPIDAPLPSRDALATGRPVLLRSLAERDRRYPALAGVQVGQQAFAILPLMVDARPVGLAGFGWPQPRDFTDDDIQFMTTVATQCAAALDRARLLEAERASRARLEFVVRASEVLSRSLDEHDVTSRLADLLTEELTDWCVILLPDGRGRLDPRVSVHADPARAEVAGAVVGTTGLDVSGPSPAAQVFRSGEPLLVDNVSDHVFAVGAPSDFAPLAVQLEPGSGMLLPMIARRRVVGVLSVIRDRDRAGYTRADLDLLADVARRAAVALDNARLFGQRSRIASRLQESLLPAELPTVDGLDLAARYVTAEEAVEVGGDFYDVFPTAGDELLIVIGDVSGRGVDAAGATGLARQTMRAIGHDLTPAAALHRLNNLLYAQQSTERFLTAACGRLRHDGDGGFALTLACGGHTLPLLVHSNGQAELIGEPGTILGAFPDIDLVETRHALRPGDTLLLYTDGVTEAHGPDGLFGEQRLAETAATCAGLPAEEIAACVERAVLDYSTDATADDDLALLVICLPRRVCPVDLGECER